MDMSLVMVPAALAKEIEFRTRIISELMAFREPYDRSNMTTSMDIQHSQHRH